MRYICLTILWLMTSSAYADVNIGDLFSIPATDRSISYLGQIFGGNIGPLTLSDGTGLNAIVSQIFANLNAIVLAIGVSFVSYIGVLSTINTAHEGEMMGKKFSSIWIPIRASLGMLMMVPTPGTGYSLVQVSLMWVVMQGIGAADTMWNLAIDQLLSGQSVSSGVGTFATKWIDPTQKNVLYSSVCMEYLNKNPNIITNNKGPIKINGPKVGSSSRYKDCGTPGPGSWVITVGPDNAENTPYDAICGYYCNNETTNYNSIKNAQTRANIGSADAMALAKSQGIMGLFSAMSQSAKGMLSNPINFQSGSTSLGYAAYFSAVSALYGTSDAGNQNLLNAARTAGWIHAGSYYVLLNQGTAQLIEQAKPDDTIADNYIPKPPNLVGNASPYLASADQTQAFVADIGPLTNALAAASGAYDKDANIPTYTMGTAQLPGTSGVSDSLGAIGSLVGNGLKDLMHMGPGDNRDPLTTMAAFGGQLMLMAEKGWISSVTVAVIAMLLSGNCTAETPGAALLNAVFSIIFPWVTLIFVSCYTAGASMAVYMPMIPYFIFSTSAIGWMMSVIEAMVGAPLVALALVHPSGDELGKADHGLMLLANIFLRPMLMIVGFVFASRVLRTSLYVVNYGFNAAFGSSVVPSGGTFGVMGWVVPLITYCGFVNAIISRCFTLIYVVPDKIMRWLGGPSEDTGAMVSETVSQTKGSVDKGMESANKVQGGMSDGVGAAQKMNQKRLEGGKGKK